MCHTSVVGCPYATKRMVLRLYHICLFYDVAACGGILIPSYVIWHTYMDIFSSSSYRYYRIPFCTLQCTVMYVFPKESYIDCEVHKNKSAIFLRDLLVTMDAPSPNSTVETPPLAIKKQNLTSEQGRRTIITTLLLAVKPDNPEIRLL